MDRIVKEKAAWTHANPPCKTSNACYRYARYHYLCDTPEKLDYE